MLLRKLLVKPGSFEQRVLSQEQVVFVDSAKAKPIKGGEAVVGVNLSQGTKTIIADKPTSSMQGFVKCKVAGRNKDVVALFCDRAFVRTNLNMVQQDEVQKNLNSLYKFS